MSFRPPDETYLAYCNDDRMRPHERSLRGRFILHEGKLEEIRDIGADGTSAHRPI